MSYNTELNKITVVRHATNKDSVNCHLSYDATVFQWITLCNKKCLATGVFTLLQEYVTSFTTLVPTM